MPRNVMVTTCGTSLLTNAARDDAQRKLLREIANAGESDLTTEQRSVVDALADVCRQRLEQSDLPTARRLSAEINGLMGFYNNQPAGGKGDTHYLLHTDTYVGEAAAKLIQEYLEQQAQLRPELLAVKNLRTDTLENFHAGLGEIIRWCQENLPAQRQAGAHLVFNLSGGFKSIQGWMQTLGMFYADEMIYIFEDQKELLRIPRVPVNIDAASAEQIKRRLPLFRRLAAATTVKASELPADIAEVFVYRLGDEVELSPWGKLVWEQVKGDLYASALLEPPDERIVYSDKFRRAAAGRTRDEFAMLNERLDDFAAYLRSKGQNNPRRLDAKPFKGKAPPPSTHEFDAWAKRPAWRVFFHDEGGKKILDDLREGMH